MREHFWSAAPWTAIALSAATAARIVRTAFMICAQHGGTEFSKRAERNFTVGAGMAHGTSRPSQAGFPRPAAPTRVPYPLQLVFPTSLEASPAKGSRTVHGSRPNRRWVQTARARGGLRDSWRHRGPHTTLAEESLHPMGPLPTLPPGAPPRKRARKNNWVRGRRALPCAAFATAPGSPHVPGAS